MTLIDPVRSSGATIPPYDQLGFGRFPDLQPFSDRTASGYQETLESMFAWITRRLIPYLREQDAGAVFDANVDLLIAAVNAALVAQTADNVAKIEAALNAIATAQVPIADPVILAVLNTATAQTRAWLDARYQLAGLVAIAPAPKGGGQDDTAALMQAIAPLHGAGATLLLQRGLYRCNLDLPTQFQQVTIAGHGFYATELRSMSGAEQAAVVKFNGGSGTFGGGGIQDVRISSADGVSNKNRGVVFSGTTGCTARRVQFRGSLAIAVLFWNERTGDFTEFCRAVDCDIAGAYRPVTYYVTNGVESFHGSGVQDCTINVPGDFTGPIVNVMDGALPYNAPLSFQVWFHAGYDAYLLGLGSQSAPGRHRSFHGTITVEGNSGIDSASMCRGAGLAYLLGGVSWLGVGSSKLGSLILAAKIAYEGSRVWAEPLPISSAARLKNTPTIVAAGCFEESAISMVAVHVQAANYEYHAVLLVQQSQFDGNQAFITELGRTQFLDSGAKGAPTWSFNGALYCSNPNFTTDFACYVTVTYLGGSVRHNLLAQSTFV